MKPVPLSVTRGSIGGERSGSQIGETQADRDNVLALRLPAAFKMAVHAVSTKKEKRNEAFRAVFFEYLMGPALPRGMLGTLAESHSLLAAGQPLPLHRMSEL